MLFKPSSIEDETWSKLLHELDEISSRESIEHDICLIGSHARGDASLISDIDLVLFSEGDSNLNKTEIFFINQNIVSIFSVNINSMLQAESLDFYNVNNPFEAELVYGNGKVLNAFRKGLYGKMINLDETKKIVGQTVSRRLRSALRDTIRDYGEGIRNMRGCLIKLKLNIKLHRNKIDPWLMIPYLYQPEDELEKLINELY
ncbi:MAG: nucleotidyltransferase domain-containing protein, partial [Candidatus Methylarchaceae archaeon HK01M]|nr:nucleotidyltransferase domain-containing protein [Candidatus Methylarchaceae archaeon HK01M]